MLDYQASSPDEKALVEACAKIGFIFTGEENDHMIIKLQNYHVIILFFKFIRNETGALGARLKT